MNEGIGLPRTEKESVKTNPKQILVLFGSPHKNGSTAQLLEAFLQPLAPEAEIKIINAFQYKITPCSGCEFCTTAEQCAMRDFDELDALIRLADVLVVATPVYYLSFPAPLKAIIDRTQRYFSARFSLGINPPIQKPKLAAVLVTAGSTDFSGADIIFKQLKLAFSVMNTSVEGMAVWTNTDSERGAQVAQKAGEAAKNLALAIKSKL
jgi:multimeric flavodoxin WrbA